jgi:hypothetical protein
MMSEQTRQQKAYEFSSNFGRSQQMRIPSLDRQPDPIIKREDSRSLSGPKRVEFDIYRDHKNL